MVMRNVAFLGTLASLIVAPPGGANAKDFEQSGVASVYIYGKPVMTASGERTNDAGLNAAHKSLPFGTMVKVTNRRNGHSVVVKIIDRGPFVRGRVIDVTPAAAKALGFWGAGVTPVTLAIVGRG